ncbi:MAG: hypothetical protein LLG20_16505 [Acidobacteriales bacterium]|nr:hypothetical protein [Terriglobales bacterium]
MARKGSAPTWSWSLTLVAAGQGIAILPMMCALNLRHDEVRIVRMQPDSYRCELTVAWQKDSPAAVLRGFTELVRETQKEIEVTAMAELAKIAHITAAPAAIPTVAGTGRAVRIPV